MTKEDLKVMPKKELKKLYNQLDDLINVVECFNSSDVILFDWAGAELDRRENKELLRNLGNARPIYKG